jgi:hypothetical protein
VLAKAEADSLTRAIGKYRDDERADLKSGATSYLATTRRYEYLWRDRLRVGTADTCDIRLNDPGIMPHHLTVAVVGDSFQVQAEDPTFAQGRPRCAGHVARPVTRSAATRCGSHQNFPNITVFDPQSPRMKSYKGIDYYPSTRLAMPPLCGATTDTPIIA